MALENWEKAIQDLTMVVSQAGKANQLIEASAFNARSTSLIHLNRFGHAIQDLQRILSMSKNKKGSGGKHAQAHDTTGSDGKEDQEILLNCILIGNLYCHLALDQMKVSATVSQKNAAFTPFILEQLKTTHLNMGFITKAEEYYDEALKISPDHFLVYYFRGRMLALSAQLKKAAECLSDCLRLHPMFLPALFLRGCIYAQQSLTILALADFYRVRHRASSYPNLHTSIGFCHFDCGSMAKAVEALTEAVQQDSNDADALYIRGCALQELFVLESAIKDFSRVLSINPKHFRALYQRSVCFVLYQKYREALDDLDKAIQLQPEWKEAWNLHAYTCFCFGHYEDAVISYGQAIGLRDASTDSSSHEPTPAQRDSQLFLHRSLANMYANHFSAALLDLDLALKRDNENYIAFVAKAFMLLKLGGEYDRAMQALLHALPQYKKMRLMSPCDVIDPERAKAFKKQSGGIDRSGSFIGNPFGSGRRFIRQPREASAVVVSQRVRPGLRSDLSVASSRSAAPEAAAQTSATSRLWQQNCRRNRRYRKALATWHRWGPRLRIATKVSTISKFGGIKESERSYYREFPPSDSHFAKHSFVSSQIHDCEQQYQLDELFASGRHSE